MKQKPYTSILSTTLLVLLCACGSKTSATKGFFSDANICRPIALPDYDPTDILSGKLAIPAPTSGTVRTAQLTSAETEEKSVWGVEIYLSNLIDSDAAVKVSPGIKRKDSSLTEITTLGPDNAPMVQPFIASASSMSAKLQPGWVRAQFPGILNLRAGDAAWLITEPDFTGSSQSILWWYTAGSGAYFSAAGTSLYVNIPGIQTIYRLIYCE